MSDSLDEAAVAAALQRIWRLRLGLRQQQQVSSQAQARQRARHRAQVSAALQRHLYRIDSER